MTDYDISLRAVDMDDLPVVLDLLTAYAIEMTGNPSTDKDSLKNNWARSNLAEDAWVAVLDTDEQIVGYEHIYWIPSIDRALVVGCVHPQMRNQGIGDLLLSRLESRALEADVASITLSTRVYHEDQAAIRLFEDHRFDLERRWWRMEMSTDQEIEQPIFPPHITIRSFDPEQETSMVYEAEQEAFAEHFNPIEVPFDAWRDRMMSGNYDPTLWWVAMDGDELAGFTICQTNRNGEAGLGWIRVLGVRKQWRKQGLGLALLLHSFQHLKKVGMKRIGLHVDSENTTGATRLYERAGMSVSEVYDHYAKQIVKPEV